MRLSTFPLLVLVSLVLSTHAWADKTSAYKTGSHCERYKKHVTIQAAFASYNGAKEDFEHTIMMLDAHLVTCKRKIASYSNGQKVSEGKDYYYPNGMYLSIGNNYFYPNGQKVNEGNDNYYPSGVYASIGGQYYYPNGERVNIGQSVYWDDAGLRSEFNVKFPKVTKAKQPGCIVYSFLVSGSKRFTCPAKLNVEQLRKFAKKRKGNRRYMMGENVTGDESYLYSFSTKN